MRFAHLGRRLMAVALEQPMPVEPLLERQQLASELLDGLEPPDPQQLFLEGCVFRPIVTVDSV